MALFGSGNPFGQGLLGGNLGGMTEEDIRALIAGYDPRAGRGEPPAVWQLPPGSGAEPPAVWQLPPGSGAEPSAAWASAPQLPPPININRAPGQFFGSPYAPVEPQMMQEANERAQQIRQQQPYLPPASAMVQPPQDAAGGGLRPPARGTDLASGLPIQPDRFGAGMYGFANANGPLQAIAQMIGGLKTGQRQDAQGIAQQQQRATYETLKAKLGHAGAMAAMTNPKVLEEWAKREFAPYGFGQNNGVVFNQDPRTGALTPVISVPQFLALPDGSAAVTYQAPISRELPEGPASGGGLTTLKPAGPNFDQTSRLRQEITTLPETKRYTEALPIYRSMVKSHDKDSAAADLDFVYGVAKIFDPESVVREGEMKLVGKAQSIPEDVQGFMKRAAFGEGRLTSEARRRILEVAGTRMNELRESYNERTAAYPGIARRFNIDSVNVMPRLQEHPDLPPAAAAPPATPVEGSTATNPKTLQKIIFRNGQWVPLK